MSVRIHEGVAEYERRTTTQPNAWHMPRRPRFYAVAGKRIFDIFCVLLALPTVLPFVLLLAVLIARDGHSPFYRQQRIGRGGRSFMLWKLRTMVPDADRQLEQHLAENEAARLEWDTYQKLGNDPRITGIGRFLRASSLDEIPQLWNVLKGDMSLVGPRPMMPEQRSIYPGTEYYALRPGVTGPWQVSERNESTFAQRADFDADYARRLSFMTDVRLILATVNVVLRCTGR